MNIHEYQAKEIFAQFGSPVPRGGVARTPDEVRKIAEEIGKSVVVKAQVHVGGRGKAGGIKLAETSDEAFENGQQILGMDIKGFTVKQVLVEEAVDITHEAYVGIIMDRQSKKPVFMVSAAGGIDIEDVAKETPENIHNLAVDPFLGLLPYQARELAYKLYDDPAVANQAARILTQLYLAFVSSDASLAEINPLATTPDGKVWAVDGKMNIDDSALYKQPQITEMRDPDAENTAEVEAREAGLSFVKLDGNIGCLVNGAGLAMATMDVIKLYGGEPANFLDVGGGANEEQVTTAFGIIMEDANVKGILVNIFGGIMRCDIIARGVIAATQALALEDPLVVRLVGTNFEEGRRILSESGLNIHTAETLAEGAQKIVELVGGEN